MKPYRTVFNREALEFIANTDDDTYAEIEQWVNRIERSPFTSGDYTEQDADHRDLQIIVLCQVAVAYWPDHAMKEVRVVRIENHSDA
jgi:hypothetical protein